MSKNRNSKILIIGPIPPPSGGVSLHIQRMANLIENDFEIEFIDESKFIKSGLYNIRSLNFIQYLKKVCETDLIYVHSGVTILKIFHIIIGRITFKKIILTIHSYPKVKNIFLKCRDEFFFRLANIIIVVNEDILKRLELPYEKCKIQHAFIPPKIESEPDLPRAVNDWINEKKIKGVKIICANASKLEIFNNLDLYGLDMCIDVTYKLKNRGLPICFVYNVSSLDRGQQLFSKYHSSIERLALQDEFLLLNENLSFVRLIERSDIVLRPTNTDGDALTVREALYLGKPVISSDVVERPQGTILFKTRDMNDLEIKLLETLNYELVDNLALLNRSEDEFRVFYLNLINEALQK